MDGANITYNNSLNSFCIVGINYRKSDMNIRGKFSLSTEQSVNCLKQSVANKIEGSLVLSTCNRTEIYGITNEPNQLAAILCESTDNSMEDLLTQAYVYRGIPAIEHLFKVASGLDSQIIGDYEILSQLKLSAKLSREEGCLNSFLERAINYSLQVSKEIKTKTKLSSGTVSVAYAAIEIIKEKYPNLTDKKILLVGTGKFGNQIANNITDYLGAAEISFTNRTDAKALKMAALHDATFIPYKDLAVSCNDADIIIVNTTSKSYTVCPSFFRDEKYRLILDLSVPQNVDPAIKNISAVTILNVDQVSQMLDKTIARRQAEVPKALRIIDETLNSLAGWHRQQFNNPLLRMVKSQLFQLNEIYFTENNNTEKIHKTVSSLALLLKEKNNKGCQCISAINSYLDSEI